MPPPPLLKKLPTPSHPSPSRPSPSRPSPSLPLPHPPPLLLPRQILALTKHAPPTSRLLHQPDAQGRGHFQRLLLSMTVPGNTPRVFYVRPDRPPPISAPPLFNSLRDCFGPPLVSTAAAETSASSSTSSAGRGLATCGARSWSVTESK